MYVRRAEKISSLTGSVLEPDVIRHSTLPVFCRCDGAKSGLARELGGRLQSRNVLCTFPVIYSRNKQYITVDNSYILLYTVCQEEDTYEDYNQQFINGTYI